MSLESGVWLVSEETIVLAPRTRLVRELGGHDDMYNDNCVGLCSDINGDVHVGTHMTSMIQ